MPAVNPPGSSPPPVSGSLEDPQQTETVSYIRTFPEDSSDPGHPEQVEVNHSPEQRNTGEERNPGDDEGVCSQSRKREEVIKEISISSTVFIGPACRPQPVIEDELSEFYKELEHIDQHDTVDGSSESVTQSYTPSDTVDGNSEYVSQSYTPPDTVAGNSERVSHSYTPPINPPAIHQVDNNNKHTYSPYPALWQRPSYRNPPQWRPQSYDMTCIWSKSNTYQDQWALPPPPPLAPPNFRFYALPRPGNPTHPAYSHPQGHEYGQFVNRSFQVRPNISLTSSPSPASCTPYEVFERGQYEYEEQNDQDADQQTCDGGPCLVLVLMRGLPGSGKSTLAKQISSRGPSGLILSTDDYFYHKDGYHFEPTLLGAAHDWNQNRAKKAMLDRRTPIIIDNTNVQAWEMKPYVAVALEMGYRVEFVESNTSWKCDPVELEKRNHHGVSRESIVNMLDRFELPISVDIVMNSYQPSHKRKEHHFRLHRHR